MQPETGWQAPAWMSFNTLVQAIIEHRKSNPALAKQHQWVMDPVSVANELDAYNTQICLAHGWTGFIVMQGPSAPFPPAFRSPLKDRLAAAAGSVGRVAAGIQTLLDWLGSGGAPVDQKEAESRAMICSTCPKNEKGDWKRFFTVPAAEQIKLQLEMRNNLSLKTSQDAHLNVCSGCDCVLKLKVWTPMSHVLKYTTEETKKRLDPRCWVLR